MYTHEKQNNTKRVILINIDPNKCNVQSIEIVHGRFNADDATAGFMGRRRIILAGYHAFTCAHPTLNIR